MTPDPPGGNLRPGQESTWRMNRAACRRGLPGSSGRSLRQLAPAARPAPALVDSGFAGHAGQTADWVHARTRPAAAGRARAASQPGSQHVDLAAWRGRVEAVLDQPADRPQAPQRPPRAYHAEVDVGAVAGHDVAKVLLVSERQAGEVVQGIASRRSIAASGSPRPNSRATLCRTPSQPSVTMICTSAAAATAARATTNPPPLRRHHARRRTNLPTEPQISCS